MKNRNLKTPPLEYYYADKNDAMVKISLPENNKTIVASKYQLYLPTEKQLIEEVKKESKK